MHPSRSAVVKPQIDCSQVVCGARRETSTVSSSPFSRSGTVQSAPTNFSGRCAGIGPRVGGLQVTNPRSCTPCRSRFPPLAFQSRLQLLIVCRSASDIPLLCAGGLGFALFPSAAPSATRPAQPVRCHGTPRSAQIAHLPATLSPNQVSGAIACFNSMVVHGPSSNFTTKNAA